MTCYFEIALIITNLNNPDNISMKNSAYTLITYNIFIRIMKYTKWVKQFEKLYLQQKFNN